MKSRETQPFVGPSVSIYMSVFHSEAMHLLCLGECLASDLVPDVFLLESFFILLEH